MLKVAAIVTHALVTFSAIALALGIFFRIRGTVSWHDFGIWSGLNLGVTMLLGILMLVDHFRKRRK
jgi:hypothetical protein